MRQKRIWLIVAVGFCEPRKLVSTEIWFARYGLSRTSIQNRKLCWEERNWFKIKSSKQTILR